MSLLYELTILKEKLWKLKMYRTKKVYLSVKEIQDKMQNNEPMPTSIFNATKTDYIVKARTIYGPKPKLTKQDLASLKSIKKLTLSRDNGNK